MSFIQKQGNYYVAAPSRRKNKKYDVYDLNHKYVVSFGDLRYEHYHDDIGYYSHLNHLDDERRRRYRLRHKNDNTTNPKYAGYWSMNYLW